MRPGVWARRLAATGFAAALIAGTGCREAPEPSSGRESSDAQSEIPPAPRQPDLTGVWTVVAHHTPGISALSEDEAKARHGETVRLTITEALSSGDRCDEPSYATSTVPAEEYLATEFKIPPGGLNPLASHETIALMEVHCAGRPWAGFGGLLLGIDADRALTPWDGVFFELERDRDFRAVGQELGWQLEIRKGVEIRFCYDYGQGEAITPVPAPEVDPETRAQTYHAVTEKHDLRVVIEPKACSDAMSGEPYPATVRVTLDERTFDGCGGPAVGP